MPRIPTYPVVIYPDIISQFKLNNPKTDKATPITISKQVVKEVVKQPKKNKTLNFIALSLSSMLLVLLIYYFCIQKGNWLVLGGVALMLMGGWAILGATSFPSLKQHETKTEIVEVPPPPPPQEFSRQKKLAATLTGKVLEPKGISKAQQGVSEAQFFRELRRFFHEVEQGVTFQIEGFNHPYSADFILRHPTGLSIDIEIDEPYVGKTGKPHHGIDQGKDDVRNKFFVEHNWIVVRFSEEQVVRYPRRCCKVIAHVLSEVCDDQGAFSELKNTPELPKMARWTIKEAKRMAKQNYRKTYL